MATPKGMDFARGHLQKLGWKEGEGLGRDGCGMAQPIRPKRKFDKAGLGVDPGAEFTTNWWEQAFDQTVKSIAVSQNKNGDVAVQSTSKKAAKPHKTTSSYGDFVKGAVLDNGLETSEGSGVANEITKTRSWSESELLKACEGRTAHKAARHGNRLSGKLSRVEHQEMEYKKSTEHVAERKGEQQQPKRKRKKLKQ